MSQNLTYIILFAPHVELICCMSSAVFSELKQCIASFRYAQLKFFKIFEDFKKFSMRVKLKKIDIKSSYDCCLMIFLIRVENWTIVHNLIQLADAKWKKGKFDFILLFCKFKDFPDIFFSYACKTQNGVSGNKFEAI